MNESTKEFARARKPHQIEERKEAIIDSALSLFVAEGFENVSLRDIGRVVGISQSNIYRYFESREHIYLVILQRSGATWENKVFTALRKMNGNGSIGQVAETLARSFASSKTYCMLMTVINSVLEKNLSAELVLNFRKTFLQRRERLAEEIAAAIPGASREAISPLMFSLFAFVSGLWPLSHPTNDIKKLLSKPEFDQLTIDFESEVTRFVETILRGALNEARK